jgi:hypothetical protein
MAIDSSGIIISRWTTAGHILKKEWGNDERLKGRKMPELGT